MTTTTDHEQPVDTSRLGSGTEPDVEGMETERARAERHERERIESHERHERERKQEHERHERERREQGVVDGERPG